MSESAKVRPTRLNLKQLRRVKLAGFVDLLQSMISALDEEDELKAYEAMRALIAMYREATKQ